MIIFVKTLTSRTISVDIESTETIFNLKKKIEKEIEMPIEQQRLICGGKQLENDYTFDLAMALYKTDRYIKNHQHSFQFFSKALQKCQNWFRLLWVNPHHQLKISGPRTFLG